MTVPCVRCGYCCKRAPCWYGKPHSEGLPQCKFLVEAERLGDVPIYSCSAYEEIKRKPGASLSPAFGAGCSSDLFNDTRDRVIVAREEEHERREGL